MSRSLRALPILAALVACSTPKQSEVDPAGPDPATFAPVANALVARCGSLDCHGSPYRNMRLFGYAGLRLSPDASVDKPTFATPDEVAADYDAVVGLEPEIMRDVAAAKGADAERLTLFRKAYGTEHHKGLSPIAKGDPADVCLLSWFAGAVDVASCNSVAEETLVHR
jgi:hypothetical protein